VVYQWNNNAEPGKTYSVTLSSIDTGAAVMGLPVSGNPFTLTNSAAPILFNTANPDVAQDRVRSVFLYNVESEPASTAYDSNWKNGIVKIQGDPKVNPASNITVSGTQSDNNRLEIKINGDGTFSYRNISSAAAPPAFAGNLPIQETPVVTIPGTGVSLRFSAAASWTTGDEFRIATWFTEPGAGTNRGTFPARALVVATQLDVSIYNADSRALWLRFNRVPWENCASQQRVFSCSLAGSGSNLRISDLFMAGGRLYFSINLLSSSVSTHGGLYVVDFGRDEAFRLTNGAATSRYYGSATTGTLPANLRERDSAFTYQNPKAAIPLILATTITDLDYYYDAANSVLLTAHVNSNGRVEIIRWTSPTPTRSSPLPGGISFLAFDPSGSLFFANSSVIYRTIDYANACCTQNLTGVTSLTAMDADATGVYLGHQAGIKMLNPVSLDEMANFNQPASVSSLEAANGYLFSGITTETAGGIDVRHIGSGAQSFYYSKDSGMPSNDTTAVSTLVNGSNFLLAAGTRDAGAILISGTFNTVSAFSGITMQERTLFNSQALTPASNVPLLWFDLINDRNLPATLDSISTAVTATGNLSGSSVKLFRDADLSGSVTAGDTLYASHVLEPFNPGANLLQNAGADNTLVNGEIPSWTEMVGANWTRRTATPAPFSGSAYFFPGAVPVGISAELRQDVSISAYQSNIDSGTQRFHFEGYVRSLAGDTDTSRIVVEYLDSSNFVLSAFDSGQIENLTVWQQVKDSRIAPAGARTIRVRLLAINTGGPNSNTFFDALSLNASTDSGNFRLPAQETLNAKDRASFLAVADLPPSDSGSIQVSIPDNSGVSARYGAQTALVTGAPATGATITVAPRIEITSPPSAGTFTEGTQISVTAVARNEVDDVQSILIQATGVLPQDIAYDYSPASPALTRTVTATFTLPTIAANGGSNQVSITATAVDGSSTNSLSIPITLQ